MNSRSKNPLLLITPTILFGFWSSELATGAVYGAFNGMANPIDGAGKTNRALHNSSLAPQPQEFVEQWLHKLDHEKDFLISSVKNNLHDHTLADCVKHKCVKRQVRDRHSNDSNPHTNSIHEISRPDKSLETCHQSRSNPLLSDIGSRNTKHEVELKAFPSPDQGNQQTDLVATSSNLNPFSNDFSYNSIEKGKFDSTNSPSKRYRRRQRHKTKLDKYEYKGDVKTIKESGVERTHEKIHKKRKKNGTALNSEFRAPNVDSERVTLQRDSRGFTLSRSKVTTVFENYDLPDLTFAQMKFLTRRKRQRYGDPQHPETTIQDQLTDRIQLSMALGDHWNQDKCNRVADIACEYRDTHISGNDPCSRQSLKIRVAQSEPGVVEPPISIKPLLDDRSGRQSQQELPDHTDDQVSTARNRSSSASEWFLTLGSKKHCKSWTRLQHPSDTEQTTIQSTFKAPMPSCILPLRFEEYTRNALIRKQPGVWRTSNDVCDDVSIADAINLNILQGMDLPTQEMGMSGLIETKCLGTNTHAYDKQVGSICQNGYGSEAMSNSMNGGLWYIGRDLGTFEEINPYDNPTYHQMDSGSKRLLQIKRGKIDRNLPETEGRQWTNGTYVRNSLGLLPPVAGSLSSGTMPMHQPTIGSQSWTDERFRMELSPECCDNPNSMQQSSSCRPAKVWYRVSESQFFEDQSTFTGFNRPNLLY